MRSLGVEDAQAEKDDHSITIKELEKARRGVAALNLKVLNCLRVSVLKVLCTENGIDISEARKLKKKPYPVGLCNLSHDHGTYQEKVYQV